MALTPSTMVPVGTPAPHFRLPEAATGRIVALTDFAAAPALIVAFLCNHCPYVMHLRSALAELGRECARRGVAFVGINSNDVTRHPEDRPERMAEHTRTAGWTFPYLFDEPQEVARAYRAACTPDFFLFDRERRLAYRGQFDESRPGNGRPITGADLRTAMDDLLAGRPVTTRQLPSLGCNIKWKPGREPGYAAQ